MASDQRRFSRSFLYIAGFLDLFGVSLLIPLLAHEARKYGASPTLVGLFISAYGFLQFISSPLMGQASDFFGRKKVLSLCLFGAGTGYFMLGFSQSLLLMFLSRIPTGLMKHSQATIKAYLADITPPNERPAALGFLNALCSSGFIVGPVIGGHIAMTENGFHKVAFLSGLIFFVNGSFVTFIAPSVAKEAEQANDVITAIPKERPDNNGSSNDEFSSLRNKAYGASLLTDEKEGNKESNTTKPPASFNPIREFVKSVRHVPWSNIFDVFLVRFLTSLAMVIFRSSFSVVLEFRHGSTPKMNGYLMSYNAILGVIGGASVGKFARLFSSSEAMHRFFSTILVLSLGFITAAPSIEYVIAGLVPLCVSTSVLRVTSATAMYNRGGEGEKGLLTGLGDSFMSMSRMIGPTIGGIAQDHNIYGPGIVSTFLAIAGTSLSFLFDMGTFKIDLNKKKLQ